MHIVAKDTFTINITKGSDIRTDINQDLSGHSPVSSIKKFPHRFLHSLGLWSGIWANLLLYQEMRQHLYFVQYTPIVQRGEGIADLKLLQLFHLMLTLLFCNHLVVKKNGFWNITFIEIYYHFLSDPFSPLSILPVFIGPRSDHSVRLSVTDSLTDSLSHKPTKPNLPSQT